MPALTGHIFSDTIDSQAPGANNLFTKTQIVNTSGGVYLGSSLLSGLITQNLPIPVNPNNITGHSLGAYGELFYNRIFIEPLSFDLGFFTSEETRIITLFNGYFVNKTLDSIDISDTSFISITGDPTPDTVPPLVEQTYVLTVIPPPVVELTIDETITFDFTGTEDDTVIPIIGTNITFFPYEFRDKMTETLEWGSQLLEAYDGTEQRVKIRKAPRQFFNTSTFASVSNYNDLKNIFYGSRQRLIAVPIWNECRYLTSNITAGDSIINVDTQYGDFREDSLFVIYKNKDYFDVSNISSLTSSTITSARDINKPYTATSTIVIPVRLVNFLNNPTKNSTGINGVFDANFRVVDNIELETSASSTQYKDYDVMLLEPEKSANYYSEDYLSRQDVIGYRQGIIETKYPWLEIKPTKQYQYTLEGLEDIWNFRLWLHRRSGKVVPFWMPSFENDFTLLSTGTLTATIEVRDNNYADYSTERNELVFFINDGSVLFREIESVSKTVTNTIELTLDSSLSIEANTINKISYNYFSRLNSDKVDIVWLQNDVAIINIGVVEINS